MKKFIFPLIFIITLYSCGQWKTNTLKPRKFIFIKNGNNPGNVMIKTDENALDELSFGINVFNGKICTVDNLLKRVQVLDSDNEVELIIGSTGNINTEEIKAVNFNFGIIGSFTMDSADNIYIQNRFSQSMSIKGNKGIEEMSFSPSYILVFNNKGELQYTLGQRGIPDIPFYYIENLDVDETGRLFVISRSFNTWTIFRFKGKERDFYINLGEIKFEEKDKDNIYKGKIENVKMYRNGEKILISVSYYHGLRLKYRKVYDYSINDRKIIRTIINIPDPKNVLFNIVDDQHIYFWNLDSSDLKFLICNIKGNIENNLLMKFDGANNYYSRIIGEQTGKIYSYHVTEKGIELLKWE